MDYRQRKAIEAQDKKKILKVCSGAKDTSGIYFLIRKEGGFKYAYIGQSKRVLTRLAQHLRGFQHIDLSIKKHGLISEDNPTGWDICVTYCPVGRLDEEEQKYILMYANAGYQLRNATSGSQGEGKKDISDAPAKGYQEGLHNGYKKAQKEIAHLFSLHLDYKPKRDNPTKRMEKAMAKFAEFIGGGEE